MRHAYRQFTAAVALALVLALSGLASARADDDLPPEERSLTVTVARGITPMAAAYPTGFQKDLVISDKAFYDAKAMSESQIEDFILAKGKNCTSKADATCLKDIEPRETVTLTSDQKGNGCKAVTFTKGAPSWEVVDRVAKACSISPKVLLVTMQKEQSAVSSARKPATWNKLMGMGCPDGRACSSKYSGYERQLYYGADRLRAYRTWTTYPAMKSFRNQTAFTSLEGERFVIKNEATASLYTYTPWVSAQVLFFRLMQSYFPGTVNTTPPTSQPQPVVKPTLSVKAPKSALLREAAHVTGTAKDFPGGATLETEILVDGDWELSEIRTDVTGSFSIPLTANASKAGTSSWRVVATSEKSKVRVTSPTFTHKRVAPSLSAKAPKSAKVRSTAKVTGSAKNFLGGATVQAQIKVGGKWKTAKTLKKVKGSYSITLSTNSTKRGSQSWRVVATAKDGKDKVTKTFTLKRT
ncbi:MAG: hypothetical protein QM713_01975 [Arachnia sp.]